MKVKIIRFPPCNALLNAVAWQYWRNIQMALLEELFSKGTEALNEFPEPRKEVL
jgi:hypothetical protein